MKIDSNTNLHQLASEAEKVVPFPLNRKPLFQFYPWFNFYFLLFFVMLIYDNEYETKENKIEPRIK